MGEARPHREASQHSDVTTPSWAPGAPGVDASAPPWASPRSGLGGVSLGSRNRAALGVRSPRTSPAARRGLPVALSTATLGGLLGNPFEQHHFLSVTASTPLMVNDF